MIPHLGVALLVIGLILPTSAAIAGMSDSSAVEVPGSLGAKIRGILDPPSTNGSGTSASAYRDPSLDYYYAKLGSRASSLVLDDPYATQKRPRGTIDSSDSPKKPPKSGQIAEPGVGWLFVAGAVGLMFFGRRRAR